MKKVLLSLGIVASLMSVAYADNVSKTLNCSVSINDTSAANSAGIANLSLIVKPDTLGSYHPQAINDRFEISVDNYEYGFLGGPDVADVYTITLRDKKLGVSALSNQVTAGTGNVAQPDTRLRIEGEKLEVVAGCIAQH